VTDREQVHRGDRFEVVLEAPVYDAVDPVRDVQAYADFTAPSGRHQRAPGSWVREYVWRIRFTPDETGRWTYTATAAMREGVPVTGGEVLTEVSGAFECVP
jgi:hypothetical protein